jgi:hypothetical protein
MCVYWQGGQLEDNPLRENHSFCGIHMSRIRKQSLFLQKTRERERLPACLSGGTKVHISSIPPEASSVQPNTHFD